MGVNICVYGVAKSTRHSDLIFRTNLSYDLLKAHGEFGDLRPTHCPGGGSKEMHQNEKMENFDHKV